jgi:hypothetical protein
MGRVREAVRQHPALAGVVLAYSAGFEIYGLAAHRPGSLAYGVVIVVLSVLIAIAEFRVRFSNAVLWGLAAWGFLHLAGGLIPAGDGVLYNVRIGVDPIHYDRLVHAFGFGVATVACWQGLRPRLEPDAHSTTGVVFLVALMGMGLGALNEVAEFAAAHTAAGANVGGYENTGWDLVANLVGCSVAAWWVARDPAHAPVRSRGGT